MPIADAQAATRCAATTKHGARAGQRCGNPAMIGSRYCRKHGGTLPQERQKREIELSRRETERRGIVALHKDDPRGRGDSALAEELRRTIAWIDFCEAQINALGSGVSDDPDEPAQGVADVLAGLGVVKRETIGATEFEGVNVTEVVGVNVWEEKLRWNRAHLAVLTKQWLAAGFEARRLELQRDTIERMERMVNGVVRDLGHDAADPEVRAAILRRIRRELSGDETSE